MRALIADDHSLFRDGCKLLLKSIDPKVEITEAADFDETLKALDKKNAYDLILLDLRMPKLGEVEGLKKVRHLAPSTPLVVVSAMDDPYYAQKAMDYGAASYIPKSSSHSLISSALKLILAGGHYVPPTLLNKPVAAPRAERSKSELEAAYADAAKKLTPRQMDVMRLLARGESNKGIAEALGLSEGTVKVHVAAILKALKATNRTQAVLIASGMVDAVN